MQVLGIVAEYNPFHSGHAYQICASRSVLDGESGVVAIMSGNWVQAGRPAVLDKWVRARLALMGGADLVLELPTVWAVSTAESFARGAIGLMEAAGVVDVLSFGSEYGQVGGLKQVAACLNSPEYETDVGRRMRGGMPFAAARQAAVQGLLGEELSSLLATPNNNLGVEYLRALDSLKSGIRPMTVRREGAAHDSILQGTDRPEHLSATQLRAFLARQAWEELSPYLPGEGKKVLEAAWNGFPSVQRVERGILARLRMMTAEDWAKLPDSGVGEGLPPRLERAGKQCRSLEAFFALSKPKHWTQARMRRLLAWAYLGLVQADRPAKPPYLRVLGFNACGQQLLRQMKERSSLPILTKPAHARQLSRDGRRLFELEARCTDLYDLCTETVPYPGREWTTGPVRI